MRKLILIATLATIASFSVLAGSAAAETFVPPGNSAASQYTEAFPTSKGEEDSQGKKPRHVTPAEVLGPGKAHKLEEQGAAGKAVAAFAAETAPVASGEEGGSGQEEGGSGQQGAGGAGGSGGSGSGGSSGSGGGSGSGEGSGTSTSVRIPSGSSGAGEVASQATGLSSGTLGVLLPLILVAVLVWAGVYVWRNRQQQRVV